MVGAYAAQKKSVERFGLIILTCDDKVKGVFPFFFLFFLSLFLFSLSFLFFFSLFLFSFSFRYSDPILFGCLA